MISVPEIPPPVDSDPRPYTAAEAQWAAETSPLDGGWVEGEPTPFDIELSTVSALDPFNEALDPTFDQAAGEAEAQARAELGIPCF